MSLYLPLREATRTRDAADVPPARRRALDHPNQGCALAKRGGSALARSSRAPAAEGPLAACTLRRSAPLMDRPRAQRPHGTPRRASRIIAARLCSTSSVVVAHDETLIRMAARSC